MKRIIYCLLLLSSTTLFAQKGIVDLGFGSGGTTTVVQGISDPNVRTMIPLPDGKILVGVEVRNVNYTGNFKLVRLNDDGTIDYTFNKSGSVHIWHNVQSIFVREDGKILICGMQLSDKINSCTFILYNADGTQDKSFNKTGYLVLNDFICKKIISASDGGFYMLGVSKANINAQVIAKLKPDLTLDIAYGRDGISEVLSSPEQKRGFSLIAQDKKGRIVVAGLSGKSMMLQKGLQTISSYVILRLENTGKRDASFGTNGEVSIDLDGPGTCEALSIQFDDKILIAGECKNGYGSGLIRVNDSGVIDKGFQNGKFFKKIIEDVDCNIPGSSNPKKIFLNSWASQDRINNIVVNKDNSLFTCGSTENGSYNMIQSLNENGSFDNSFNCDGVLTSKYLEKFGSKASVMTIDLKGRILMGGSSFVLRFLNSP